MTTSEDLTVAVDLGGTNCRAALVDSEGQILSQTKLAVDHDQPKPTVIIDAIKEATQGYETRKAVIGVPGIVDYELQRAVFVPNLPQQWIKRFTAPWIGKETGLEVSLANDADLAGVGEAKFGAGKLSDDVVYVTISTGIGGAAILRNKLVHGKFAANDVGHIMIDLPAAESGGDHTPEMYGAGPAFERQAEAQGLEVTCEELLDLVRSGDQAAEKAFRRGMLGAASGILNLAWLYAPAMVVIGGGVGLNADLVHPVVNEVLDKWGPKGVRPIKVVAAELGDNAALVGAAGWWTAFN